MRTMRLVGTSKHTRQPSSIYTVFWERAGGRPYRLDVIYTETDLCIRKDYSSNSGKGCPKKERTRFFSSQEAKQLCYSMTTCTSDL